MRWKRTAGGIIAGLLLLFIQGAAADQHLKLPSGLREIGEKAFYGCSEITEAELPFGVESIGNSAFGGCSSLKKVHIPSSATSFGTGIFDDTTEALLIECRPGSDAMDFALLENIDFDADTVCRALLIGQSTYPSGNALYAPPNDVRALKAALGQTGERTYEVTILENQKKAEILAAIPEVFSEAREEDICLFYFSGHGRSNGALVGIEYNAWVDPAELRAALDQIPGRKVVIIDACHSGALIGRGESTEKQVSLDPSLAFMEEFLKSGTSSKSGSLLSRGNSFETNQYYIITASRGAEFAYEEPNAVKRYGLFTNALCLGCGYDFISGVYTDKVADANEDGTVTLYELYEYALHKVQERAEQDGVEQTAQIYPDNCSWFGVIR